MPQPRASLHLRTLAYVLLAVGIVAWALLLSSRSMERNAVFLGYSPGWLVVLAAALIVLIGVGFLCLQAGTNAPIWRLVVRGTTRAFAREKHRYRILFFLILSLTLAAFALIFSLDAFRPTLGTLQPILRRVSPIVLWWVVGVLGFFFIESHLRHAEAKELWTRSRLATIVAAVWTIALSIGTLLAANTDWVWRFGRYRDLYPWVLLIPWVVVIDLRLRERAGREAWQRALPAVYIALTVGVIYLGMAIRLNNYYTPPQAYYPLQAEAWLRGELFVTDPPSHHDLTLHGGEWYIANPPLPSVLMLPWIALFGADALNTVLFAVVFSAVNAGLLYLILVSIRRLGWISTSPLVQVGLCLLFTFGTVHWWIGMSGEMWFVGQITSVTFVALSILLVLYCARPAWAGACLAAALLARPNLILLVPFLIGLQLQMSAKVHVRAGFRPTLAWTLRLLIPCAAALLLLGIYNWARFGDFTDTGYMTMNAAPWLVGDLQAYGLFHPHFILRNLRVMFLQLPEWRAGCPLDLRPSEQGMSMLVATPALAWLGAAFRRRPWVLGAWVSIAASVGLLALYHNTGAWQFGYKYFLDFAIPAMALLALSAGPRPSRGFWISAAASVAINAAGVLWWFGYWC